MKRIFCDICKQEIHRYEIPRTIMTRVGDKEEEADFHETCYIKLLKYLQENEEKE